MNFKPLLKKEESIAEDAEKIIDAAYTVHKILKNYSIIFVSSCLRAFVAEYLHIKYKITGVANGKNRCFL